MKKTFNIYRTLALFIICTIIAQPLIAPGISASSKSLEPDSSQQVRAGLASDVDSHPEGQEQIKYIDTWFNDRYNGNISVRLYYPKDNSNSDSNEQYPAIIFGEGYLKYTPLGPDKSWYYWIGENLSSRGYIVMFFDFEGQGKSSIGPDLPAKYSQTSIDLWPDWWPWVHNIFDSLDWLIRQSQHNVSSPINGMLDHDRIGFIGHSTGAAMGIVAASIDTRIKTTVLMAPYDNSTGPYKQPFPTDHLEDRTFPMNIMVGEMDSVVPPAKNGRIIYDRALEPKQYIIFKDKGHEPYMWGEEYVRDFAGLWFNFFLYGDVEVEAAMSITIPGIAIIVRKLGNHYRPQIKIELPAKLIQLEATGEFELIITIANTGFATLKNTRVELSLPEYIARVDAGEVILKLGNISGLGPDPPYQSRNQTITLFIASPGVNFLPINVISDNSNTEVVLVEISVTDDDYYISGDTSSSFIIFILIIGAIVLITSGLTSYFVLRKVNRLARQFKSQREQNKTIEVAELNEQQYP